jgi:glycosyltransferase involved in cell wall biosynthesis
MNNTKPTICLNMIVKNESQTITRCLDSVKDLIDYWVISDTGSTDGTQQIIIDYFKQCNIDGWLIENEWKNFAHNRNLALAPALGKTDYILMMDADDYLLKEDGFQFTKLNASSYMLKMQRGTITYYNTKLISGNLPWQWVGVLHEYLDCHLPHESANLPGNYLIKSTTDGARSQNPDKYKNDIQVLEAALIDEPQNARYRFYLAQSYRDDGNSAKAIENYQKRADMGGWEEEVYCSLLEIAHNQQKLKADHLTLINAYVQAHTYRPQRLEALYAAVKLCRENGYYSLGCQLGWEARKTPYPREDVLFVDRNVHEWQFFDELSICAVYANKKAEAAQMMEMLLKLPSVPNTEHPRLEANLTFARS